MKSYSRAARLLALSLITALVAPQIAAAGVNSKGEYEAGFNQNVPERVQRLFIYQSDKYPRNDVTARQVRSGQIESIELRFHDEANVSNSTALYFEVVYNKPDKPASSLGEPLEVREYTKEIVGLNKKLINIKSKVYSYALGGQDFEVTKPDGVTKEIRKGLSFDDYGSTNLKLNLNVQDMWDVLLFGDLRNKDGSLLHRRNGYAGLVAREGGTLLMTLGGAYVVYATVQRMANSTRTAKILPGFKGYFRGFRNLPNNFLVATSNLAREWREIHRGKGGGAVFGKVIWITTYFGMGTAVWRLLNSGADEIMYGPEQAQMEFLHKTITQAYKQVSNEGAFDATYANMEVAESKYKEFENGSLPMAQNPTPDQAANGAAQPAAPEQVEPETVSVTVRDVQPVAHDMSFAVDAFKGYFTKYFERYDISQSSRLVEKKAKIKKQRQEEKQKQQEAQPPVQP